MGTASLSFFSFNPNHSEVDALILWNAASQALFVKGFFSLAEETGAEAARPEAPGK